MKFLWLFICTLQVAIGQVLIEKGEVINDSIRLMRDWQSKDGALVNKGGWPLTTTTELGAGNFLIEIEAMVPQAKGGGLNFLFGTDSRLELGTGSGKVQARGSLFQQSDVKRGVDGLLKDGQKFMLTVTRVGKVLTVAIDGKPIYSGSIHTDKIGCFGFKPGKGLHVYNMKVTGQLMPVKTPPFVFKCGENGYVCFRIPSLIRTKKGTLLAFAEGRKNGAGDCGNIDLVMKRSTDHGRTWGPMIMVRDIPQTAGNPCPIIDQRSGHIVMVFCESDDSEHAVLEGHAIRRVFYTISKDDGLTWSEAVNITEQANPGKKYNWLASGPGVGIQIMKGKYKGRMVVPMANSVGRDYSVHCIYSDDFGKSWKAGGLIPRGCNESQLVELSDGRLMINMRMQSHSRGKRGVAYSKDGGETWSEITHDEELPCSTCQASIIAEQIGRKRICIFVNPAIGGRNGLTVKVSADDGDTWPVQELVYPLSAGYSSVALTANGQVACLYEGGPQHYADSEGGIVISHVPLRKLLKKLK